ncbi:MAG: hypothetical protein GY927_16510 [bacterium]|nr:hypothetical protein [bacterium]
MSDSTNRGSPNEPPKNPKAGIGHPDAARARDVAATPASAQGLQSVMAVIGDNYDPAVSGSLDKAAIPTPPTNASSASKLTDKIDAARLQQNESSTVTQGLQSIMAVIGENYEEEGEPTPIQAPVTTAQADSTPVVAAEPARALITPAPQDSKNEVASSAISDLLPLLTDDEQYISQSHESAAGSDSGLAQTTNVVSAASGSTIADLLNQLKSDISTLEKGNLSAREKFNMPSVIDSAAPEVQTLLAELQGDISTLRSENDSLKVRYTIPTVMAGQGSEVTLLLNQLQGDIAGLRQENDSLRNKVPGGGGELSGLLAQLQGDISGLRQENDSLKTFYNLPQGRRKTSIGQAFLMTVGLVALVGGATVGGIYYANSINDQNNENLLALLGLQKENSQKVAALEAAVVAEKAAVIAAQRTAKAKVKVAAVAPTPPPALPKIVVKRPKLESDEVQALLADAANLIELGDLVSARQMLEYAMSQQSVEATYKLAQTFDPLHLATMASVLSVEPNLTRAKVLYYSAARQGHQAAAKRLAELRRTPG